jgi:hypothetical protein
MHFSTDFHHCFEGNLVFFLIFKAFWEFLEIFDFLHIIFCLTFDPKNEAVKDTLQN